MRVGVAPPTHTPLTEGQHAVTAHSSPAAVCCSGVDGVPCRAVPLLQGIRLYSVSGMGDLGLQAPCVHIVGWGILEGESCAGVSPMGPAQAVSAFLCRHLPRRGVWSRSPDHRATVHTCGRLLGAQYGVHVQMIDTA